MNKLPERIIQELNCFEKMVRIYCRGNHGPVPALCPSCDSLLIETRKHLEKCRYGAKKPICRECRTKCYNNKTTMRIQQVMKFSGPRLFLVAPMDALTHLSHSSVVIRTFFAFLGWLVIGLALIGIVVPGLPTTPFLLLAAYFFARSSEKFYTWLLENRLFGPIILNWQKDRTIPRRAKWLSLATILFTVTLSLWVIKNITVKIVLVFVVTAVAYFLVRLNETSE